MKEGGFLLEKDEQKKIDPKKDKDIILPYENNTSCKFCSNLNIDDEMHNIFGIFVCRDCRYKELKFITKTSCKKDYLLTEEEISIFKYLVRPNPHKGNWSDMNLYLKNEIEAFSLNKYKSFELLEEEKKIRLDNRQKKNKKKFIGKIRDLKRRTRISKKEIKEEKHVHNFITVDGVTKCSCGMVIEMEDI
ncbi:DNA repair protein Rad14 [Hamiltosporidium magnivora]|uniref:DNA repair protein Rad14 n=1 Tax=Hamiltosporidium magnivora TaxID=148818 RepID=A0A4Q9LF74_9MICR|nr:DNA repair protein Rad14 [Hamiltosporidium magnivora]